MHLLDPNILSELSKRESDARVVAHFEAVPEGELFTSAICLEEIRFGAQIAPGGNRIWDRFEAEVLPTLTVPDFDRISAMASGLRRAERHRQGKPVGYADTLIAAAAVAYDLILVTRNVRHFQALTNLRVENWFE